MGVRRGRGHIEAHLLAWLGLPRGPGNLGGAAADGHAVAPGCAAGVASLAPAGRAALCGCLAQARAQVADLLPGALPVMGACPRLRPAALGFCPGVLLGEGLLQVAQQLAPGANLKVPPGAVVVLGPAVRGDGAHLCLGGLVPGRGVGVEGLEVAGVLVRVAGVPLLHGAGVAALGDEHRGAGEPLGLDHFFDVVPVDVKVPVPGVAPGGPARALVDGVVVGLLGVRHPAGVELRSRGGLGVGVQGEAVRLDPLGLDLVDDHAQGLEAARGVGGVGRHQHQIRLVPGQGVHPLVDLHVGRGVGRRGAVRIALVPGEVGLVPHDPDMDVGALAHKRGEGGGVAWGLGAVLRH